MMNISELRCRRRPDRRTIGVLAVLALTAIRLAGPAAGMAGEAKTISLRKVAPTTVVCGKAASRPLRRRSSAWNTRLRGALWTHPAWR